MLYFGLPIHPEIWIVEMGASSALPVKEDVERNVGAWMVAAMVASCW